MHSGPVGMLGIVENKVEVGVIEEMVAEMRGRAIISREEAT